MLEVSEKEKTERIRLINLLSTDESDLRIFERERLRCPLKAVISALVNGIWDGKRFRNVCLWCTTSEMYYFSTIEMFEKEQTFRLSEFNRSWWIKEQKMEE